MQRKILALALALVSILVIPQAAHAALTIDVWTDRPTYMPNEIVTINGYVAEDGTPVGGQLVIITITKPNGDPVRVTYVTTDSSGSFQTFFNVSEPLYGDVYGDWRVTAQISGGPTDTAVFVVGTPVLNVTSPEAGSSYTVGDVVAIEGLFYVEENGEGIDGVDITIEVYNGTGDLVYNSVVTTDSSGAFSDSFTITSDMVASGSTTLTMVVSEPLTGGSVSITLRVSTTTTTTTTPSGGGLVGGQLAPSTSSSGLPLIALIPIAAAAILLAVIASNRK